MQKQELITNIFMLFPAMMKKLRGQANFAEMSKQQYQLLHTIRKHDSMPMSFYSEKLLISKPNLTVLADKLIDAGYVERGAAPDDRRLIVLKITRSGLEQMDKIWNEAMANLMMKLEKIDESTLVRLNELVIEINEIVNKFDNIPED